MKLIVGLGNPGGRYADTRHNIGFMCIDRISSYFSISVDKKKFDSAIGHGYISGERVILSKPLTYMNLSGKSVLEICRFYSINSSDIVVFYDDISLPHAKLRIRRGGSDGGHNGVKNIINMLGTKEIPRVRFGIKGEGFESYSLEDYVLSPFSREEDALNQPVLSIIPELLEELILNGIDKAMTVYNTK